MTQLYSNKSGHKLSVTPSKKHKQGAAYSYKVFIHQLYFIYYMHQVLLASVIVMTLISTNQTSEELNYTPTWPSRWVLQNHIPHDNVQLAMMQSALCAYNASSQLVSSIKGAFVKSPNAQKVMWVSMVKAFCLNDMETSNMKPSRLTWIGTWQKYCTW